MRFYALTKMNVQLVVNFSYRIRGLTVKNQPVMTFPISLDVRFRGQRSTMFLEPT